MQLQTLLKLLCDFCAIERFCQAFAHVTALAGGCGILWVGCCASFGILH
jgi:hypothetical protein